MGNGFSPLLRLPKLIRFFVGLCVFLSPLISFSETAQAVSCSPGLDSTIGTEYVANKCPGEATTYTYYSTDLICVSNTIVRDDQGTSGDRSYELTPSQMEQAIILSAMSNEERVFRNSGGTRFVQVTKYFVRGGGILDGVTVNSKSAIPYINLDVFDKVLYKNPSATVPCCLSASPPSVSITTKPSLGEIAPVNATLFSNYPVTWQLSVNGSTTSGSGTTGITWSGKDANGFPLLPGVYPATLTASSTGCTDATTNFQVSVTEPANNSVCFGCFGSDANLAGGGLTHSEDIITTSGGLLPLSLSLDYDSMDVSSSYLGRGWRHSMDITLTDAGSGSLLFREGETKRLYTYSGGAFQSPAGDYGTLTTGAGGSHDLTYRNGLAYHFAADGKISTITDRYSNSLTFVYGGTGGLLQTVTDSFGRAITFSHDPNTHWLNSVTDPNNAVFTFTPNSGRLQTITDPQTDAGITPGTRTFAYDGLTGQLLSRLDQYNNLTQYTYDTGKRVKTSKDPEGVSNPQFHSRTITYPTNYSTPTMTATLTEKDGGVWKYEYNPLKGVITKITAPAIAPDPARATDYHYAANGNLIAVTVPYNGSTRLTTFYSYDTYGNLLTKTDPVDISGYSALSGIDLSTVTPGFLASLTPPINTAFSYTWDSTDRITSVSNVRDITTLTTTITYGTEAGTGYELTTITDPESKVTKIRRDPTKKGQVVEIEDGNGKKTVFTYYPVSSDVKSGQLQTMSGPDNVKITFSDYDRNGNPKGIQATDANNNPIPVNTTLVYDALGRLRSITQSLTAQGKTLVGTYDYDQYGSLTAKDPEQNANATSGARYDFNYNRKVKRMTDALSGVTELAYGGQDGGIDRLTKVEDPRQYARGASGKSTRFVYDQAQRLQKEIDPSDRTTRYTYYDNGLLKGRYDGDPGNLLVSYTYNNRGRLLTRTRADGGYDQYTYKANGFLDTAATYVMVNSVPTLVISYSLDWYKNGWLKSITDNSGITISYGLYDGIGQRRTVTYFSGTSDQRVITYDYDSANRPWRITSTAGTFTYLYDNLGRRDTLTYPNGIVADYGFDDLNRLTGIHHAYGGNNIAFADYTDFDRLGNRKNRITPAGTESYTYDSIYRLTQAITPRGTENYGYDAVGNRTSGPGPKDTRYVHDAANRMTSGRMLDYAYDNMGNQNKRTVPGVADADKGWTLTWDNENRLKTMEKTKGAEKRTITFTYDPFGRRIGKQLVTVIGGVTKTATWAYVYDGDDIAEEIYTPPTGPQEKTFFTHGPGIDEHLAMERDGSYYYYHADGLNSITAITDQSGTPVQSYTYDSFGMVKPANTTFRNSYTYTGREWDKETGLYYYRARYFDPMEGRFVSKDPISFFGGDVNLWNYVGGNATNRIDPFGYSASEVVGAWIAGDLTIPDPSDVAWPKWIAYGLVLGGAAAIDWVLFKDPERGLPPDGVSPPVENPEHCKPGPASRPSEGKKGGKSIWDPKGGEWRYFPEDKWHNPHWDYNPHNRPKSPWQNIPINGLPPRK
jgi:RHS repeat-associated protein